MSKERPQNKHLIPAVKGEPSRNPKGRPKGAKSKFSESFYQDMLLEWQEGGKEAITKVRTEDPSTFLRVAASILPKDINISDTREVHFDRMMEGLDDRQLSDLITGLCALGSDTESQEATTEADTTDQPNKLH